MSQRATPHISNATSLFERRRYEECRVVLLEALGIYDEDENWLLASATLVMFGRCSMAIGAYVSATNAFRNALRLLQRVKHSADEAALIAGYIQKSSVDEISKEETERLRDQVEAFCSQLEFDRADQLCQREFDHAVRNCGTGDWYIAMVKVVQAMAKINRANALLDGNDNVGEAMELLDECRRLYNEAGAIAAAPANLERAHWLIAFIEELRVQVTSVIEHVQSRDHAAGEFDGPSEWQPPTAPRTAFRSWVQPFKGVRFSLGPSVAQLLDPPDQLFIRGEYAQCIREVRLVMEECKRRGDWLLGGLGLVLMARCQRALGYYADAVELLEESRRWLQNDATVGKRLSEQVQSIVDDCRNDIACYELVNALFRQSHALAANGQHADAADLCGFALRQHIAQVGETHWMVAALKAIKGHHLIEQCRATISGAKQPDPEGARSVVSEVRGLLAESNSAISDSGDGAAWVKTTLLKVRNNLDQLCDEAGL